MDTVAKRITSIKTNYKWLLSVMVGDFLSFDHSLIANTTNISQQRSQTTIDLSLHHQRSFQ